MSDSAKENFQTHASSSLRASSGSIEDWKDKTITQAFIAGQMDAQLKHADDLTRPSLKVLQARAYALAQESGDALIAAVRAEGDSEAQIKAAIHHGEVKAVIHERTALENTVSEQAQVITSLRAEVPKYKEEKEYLGGVSPTEVDALPCSVPADQLPHDGRE